MYTFAKPRYLRNWLHPVTKQSAPAYQFDVSQGGEPLLSFLLESGTPLTLQVLEDALCEEADGWRAFLQCFLTASAPYFSRPYTVTHLERIQQHAEVASLSTEDPTLPRHVRCFPRMLHFSGGALRIHWVAEETPAGIALSEEDTSPVQNATGGNHPDLTEWDAEALPEEKTKDGPVLLGDPAMLLEKQRVKEARLRAKLAVYRAQYQMNRYYDRYGGELSESEVDSDSDEDEEGTSDEEEEEGPFL